MIAALAVLLIALAPLDWWATGIVAHAMFRHPEVRAARAQLAYFGLTALAATAIAAISANFLLGSPLPRSAGFVLLTLALVLISIPPSVFVVVHYRRRR